MNNFRFYKEQTGEWYIDLPLDQFTKEDLQMVCGADIMLDIISNYGQGINLLIDTQPFDGSDVLELIGLPESGADYYIPTLESKTIGMKIWLCAVTYQVFGCYPNEIYIRRA